MSKNEGFVVNYMYHKHCQVFLGQFKSADICVQISRVSRKWMSGAGAGEETHVCVKGVAQLLD